MGVLGYCGDVLMCDRCRAQVLVHKVYRLIIHDGW